MPSERARCSARLPPKGAECDAKAVFAYGWGGGGIDLCQKHGEEFEAQVNRWLSATEIPPWRLGP